jgi:hypothetical protein
MTSPGGKRPLWKCPKCGHRFATKNLSHSCVKVPLAAHFRGRPPERKKTYDRWLAAARACGPMTAYAQKSRIIFTARVRFAGVTVHASYVDARLWLRRPIEHPLLRRSDNYGRIGYDHHFRLERPEDVDDALRALMAEAYRVGTQELTARSTF